MVVSRAFCVPPPKMFPFPCGFCLDNPMAPVQGQDAGESLPGRATHDRITTTPEVGQERGSHGPAGRAGPGGGPAGPAGKVRGGGIQASDEALRPDPRNADLWAFRAIALSGGLEEALQCGEKAMKLDPDIAGAVMPPEEL